MASHFGNIETIVVDQWDGFKAIAAEPTAGRMIYCEHADHYSVVVAYEGFKFLHIIKRMEPITNNETDFIENHKENALNIS